MATEFIKEWVNFFNNCGLPDDVSTIYALIFSENRIQKNMLLDLNKEYLRDMGITVMGDVIAILKNAKIAHEKHYREQILGDSDNINNKQSLKTDLKKTPTKMLEHLTRKYNFLDIESPSDMQVIVENNKQISPIMMNIEDAKVKTPITRKKIEVSIKNPVKKEAVQLGSIKINKILQENKEKNKIKIMPKTTEKSKKLIQQVKKKQAVTVFDRLGESSVTSTTSEFGVSNNLVLDHPNDTNKDKNSSVFSRLGEKASLVSSTSSNNCDSQPQFTLEDQLPYAGILKFGNTNKKVISSTTATMRADNEQKKSTINTNSSKPDSIKKRLGAETRLRNVQNSVESSKRQPISFSSEEKELKPSVIKLKNYSSAGLEQVKKETIVKNKLLAQKIEVGRKRSLVSSTTKSPVSSSNTFKLNQDPSESNVSPSKKVRFGQTTHRLIPSTTMPAESTSNVKNYPKLTMIINNNSVNVSSFRNARRGSLNSDKIREKISISERIGKKEIELRLKKRPLGSPLTVVSHPPKKICSVRDRLG